jgi:Na+/H+ antiporter NhaD/arsenite permease-like protein
MNIGKVESSIGLSVLRELYRNLRIKKSLLFAGLLTFLIMFSLWTFGSKIGISPDIVCFLGIGPLLLLYNSEGEDIIKNKVDFETILFLACLFIMVSCMAGSGILNFIAISMSNYIRSPQMLIFMLMIGTGISTSIFSAGPSMATMLPIAQQVILQGGFPADVVLVGIALSVCAGSSLFLTAATAGPLSQNMIEKSKLTTQDGEMAKFDLMAYLRFGLVYFVIIQLVAVFFVLFNL